MSAFNVANVGEKIYDDTIGSGNDLNKVWSSSSSFEAVPAASFNYLSGPRNNNGFVGSTVSVNEPQLPRSNKQVIVPAQKINKSAKKKFLSNPRTKICITIFVSVSVMILLAGIGLTIFASIKPCLFTRCHIRAPHCIDRFPFWAQCICEQGYAGNGKSYCIECGISEVAPNIVRIVGGFYAIPSSWPFAVYIVQNYKGRYNIKGVNYIITNSWSCGGILINQKTVLTAAHCIHNDIFEYQDDDGQIYPLQMQWNEWYSNVEATIDIYVGVNDLRKLNTTKKLRIKKVNRHEGYDEFDYKNDIATIQLQDIVDRSPSVQYACLPYNYSITFPEKGTRAYIIGWGRTSESGASSDLLKNSAVFVLSGQNCAKVEKTINKFVDSQICAGVLDGSTDTCQGDSGGGLFIRESINGSKTSRIYAVGVVSYGEGCARLDKPGIYSRTSYYIDWIRKNSDF